MKSHSKKTHAVSRGSMYSLFTISHLSYFFAATQNRQVQAEVRCTHNKDMQSLIMRAMTSSSLHLLELIIASKCRYSSY